MDTLQFSLFFVALLVAYLLVHLRLAKFETYLREMAGLRLLNDRLKAVSDVLERVRLDRIEEHLGQLHDDLLELRETGERVERATVRSGAVAGPVVHRSETGVGAGDRIRSAIEVRLLSLGYGGLRILSDLSEADLDDELEVRVECERDHMPSKGTIVTRNGGIVDVKLSSASQSFP